MKKIYLISLIIILIFFSCSNNLVIGTIWLGNMEISGADYDLEIYFKQNSISKIYVIGDFDPLTAGDEVSFGSGTYNITSKNEFTAVYSDFFILGAEYNLKLTGIINYSDGSGYGDYEIKSGGVKLVDDDWKIYKLNTY
ncbi:MAG: hypothetical protein JXB50_02100 [Spirochaetes bacterium]|nr:hypothetical protein [Spirochaetota bacterium]